MTQAERVKRFRSIDEMMADRREEMLKDPLWLMKQTMRDLRDPYLNYDLPVEPQGETKPVFLPRPVDKEIDQLKAQVQWLTNKITEFRAVKAKPRYKKYQQ